MGMYRFDISTSLDIPIAVALEGEWEEPSPASYACNEPMVLELFHDWARCAFTSRGMLLNPKRFSPRELYEALTISWPHGFTMDGNIPDVETLPLAEQWEDEAKNANTQPLVGAGEHGGIMEDHVLEQAEIDIEREVRSTSAFEQIEVLFHRLFNLDSNGGAPTGKEAYKDESSDYGLKVRGKKAREKLNAQCREILGRASSPDDLTPEDRAILLQYSGRGGLTENSQHEYYTPPHVAEGVWDALKANGFANGNVLDPCCGAGIFSGTKPGGVVVTASDLDPVGSGVAALLNPTDLITTQPFERVAMNTPDDTFDSCVGNVPFGNARGASLHEDPAYKNEKLIERYFLQRIIDKLRPGGLACLVVPTNIVGAKGKRWEEWRTILSRKAEFLGAHKLPSKTFSAQGTDTVVDVVVLRKHSTELANKVEELGIDALRGAHVVWPEFIEGRYWQGEGRQFIMGRYVPKTDGDRWGREVVDGDIDDAALKQKLARKFHSRIDWDALTLAEPVTRAYAEGDRRSISGTMYVFQAGQWEKVVEQLKATEIEEVKFGAKSAEELRAKLSSPKGSLSLNSNNMLAVYKSFPDMLSALQKDAVEFALSQPKDDFREQIYRGSILGGMLARMATRADAGEDVSEDRAELQELIAAEIERFGHPKNNKGLLLAGNRSRMFGMFQNAVDEQGNFSDLLAGTLDKSRGENFNPSDPADIVAHLFVRQGQEDIHLEDVLALYSGGQTLTLGDLADREGVAITPDGRVMPMNRYCAGDVYPKIAECAEAIAATDDERLKSKFRSQIALMNQRRVVTASEDIVFGLRQKWLSRKYVVDFLRENGFPKVKYGTVHGVETESYDGTTEITTEFAADYENPEGEFSGLLDSEFYKQFEKYLNGGKITSSHEDIKAEYLEKANSLERQFNVWLQQHPDISDITEQYNRQFNGHVPFEYEGDPLGIDEYISGEIMPHSYQNAEVRRLSEQGSGICGFGVGLGKSFTALATVAYNHKKGRAKRTCIVVPSAVLENWYHEARQFYSESYLRSSVLFVGLEPEEDKDGVVLRREILDEQGKPRVGKDGAPTMQDVVRFRPAKEQIFEDMWKIPQSNFNLVVMSKEKFKAIPLRPSTMRRYTDEMVSRSLMSEKLADKVNSGKRSYQDDKAIANTEAKFSDQGTKKTDEFPYLEDMGFDSIITDESHFFKNSFEAGKESQGVAYLPTAPASQIAIDMAIKSHYIRGQNNGRGVYGLTATPVTNSPFEIFNMLSLVCPIEEFERFGVRTVDDFVRVFGKMETVSKLAVSGEVREVMGLVGFQNLDGLRNLFHKYVTVKTVKDVDNEIHVPLAEEHEENVEISDTQAALYQGLRKRAKEAAKPGPKGPGESIFSIIRDMDRLTTDIDMFKRTMTFVFQAKHRDAVKKLVELLPTELTAEDVDDDTGEKFSRKIKVDFKIEDSGGDTFTLVVPDLLEDVVLMHFAELGIVESEVAHPVTPKYAKLMENLKKHFECGGKQLVFTEEKTQHQKLRRIIVHHLPVTTEQIGIINAEDASGDKLDKIAKAYNAGQLKIVIANKKAEVGVNLQKGTTAIHHLTLPWTPASINQRNGRGVRQGNTVESVAIYYYCGKGTFDSYRKDLLQAKSNWINDLLTGQAASMENGDVTGMDELLDMLADNPEQAKRQRAERLAAAAAKKNEAARAALVNKLQVLASIQTTLDGLDAKKEEKRASLRKQLERAKGLVARLEADMNQAGGESEKKTAAEEFAKSKLRKADIEADLATLDAKFDEQRAKQEANKKMAVGILRQAEREGKLPFSVGLIDKPKDAIVSVKGELFCVGDMIEIQHNGEILKVIGVDHTARSVTLESLFGRSKSIPIGDIPAFVKVSYSESELALKKLLGQTWEYAQLRKSGIDKDAFLAHLSEMDISTSKGCVCRHEGNLLLCNSKFDMPKGAVIAWPDPEDEDWRKAVCVQYIEMVKRKGYGPSALMPELFGPDFKRIAESYGHTGTDAEIMALVSETWAALKTARNVQTGKEEAYLLRFGVTQSLVKAARDQYDNASDIDRIVNDVVQGLRQKADKRAAEEAEEAQRLADEALRSDPRYKEIPKSVIEAFSSLGITVRVNTKEAYLSGYKGRQGKTYEPFSRWWFQDKKAKMGILFKMKDILKSSYGAQFTSEWVEHSGAWWHVPASVSLDELHELLS